MEDNQLIAYFSDIYNIRSACRDTDIGQIKLPWNNQVIDIYIDYFSEKLYRPVVDSVCAAINSCILLT